jgi:anti-sigma regulatory factor (Ser/Thr protein kinase)
MQPHEGAVSNGRRRSPAESVAASSELDGLRLACRRQARVIELLSAVASNLRSGAAELRAENAELRSAHERMGRQDGDGAARGGEALQVRLPLDGRAPGAARIVVGRLRGRVPALVLEDALLVVSELVTNSVCHSGASDGAIVVRVELTGTMVRLEAEDPGRGGVIAPRAPDLSGGFGLNLVQGLCERWGLERVATGGTRVWAQLARASAPAPAEASGGRATGARLENGKPSSARAARAGGGPREETHDASHVIPDERTWRVYDSASFSSARAAADCAGPSGGRRRYRRLPGR